MYLGTASFQLQQSQVFHIHPPPADDVTARNPVLLARRFVGSDRAHRWCTVVIHSIDGAGLLIGSLGRILDRPVDQLVSCSLGSVSAECLAAFHDYQVHHDAKCSHDMQLDILLRYCQVCKRQADRMGQSRILPKLPIRRWRRSKPSMLCVTTVHQR